LEASAGIAGLAKMALAIENRAVPPSLHFKSPNPRIPFERIPMRVQAELGPWPRPAAPLVGGVSSFGFSGTNAHVVLSEPPRDAGDRWKEADALAARGDALVLPISAKTDEALRAYAIGYADLIENHRADVSHRDIAYTASCRRVHLEKRLAVVGHSRAE